MTSSNGKKIFFLSIKSVAWLLSGAIAAFVVFVIFALFAGSSTVKMTEFSKEEEKELAAYVGITDIPESFKVIDAEYVNDIVSGAVLTVRFSTDADDQAEYNVSQNIRIVGEEEGKVITEVTASGFISDELNKMASSQKPKAGAWVTLAVIAVLLVGALTMAIRCIVKIIRLIREN